MGWIWYFKRKRKDLRCGEKKRSVLGLLLFSNQESRSGDINQIALLVLKRLENSVPVNGAYEREFMPFEVKITPEGVVFPRSECECSRRFLDLASDVHIATADSSQSITGLKAQEIQPRVPSEDIPFQHPLIPFHDEKSRLRGLEGGERDQRGICLLHGSHVNLRHGDLLGECVVGVEEGPREKGYAGEGRPYQKEQKGTERSGHPDRGTVSRKKEDDPANAVIDEKQKKNKGGKYAEYACIEEVIRIEFQHFQNHTPLLH
jgi:hypothetical protein